MDLFCFDPDSVPTQAQLGFLTALIDRSADEYLQILGNHGVTGIVWSLLETSKYVCSGFRLMNDCVSGGLGVLLLLELECKKVWILGCCMVGRAKTEHEASVK